MHLFEFLNGERSIYLAGKSDASLQHVCSSLEQTLALDAFDYDAEDTWVYASSAGAGFGFNVTRTEDTATIATWMASAPTDVNYQVVLTYYGTFDEAAFQRVKAALQEALNTEILVYQAV
jgi:hypothetical protein